VETLVPSLVGGPWLWIAVAVVSHDHAREPLWTPPAYRRSKMADDHPTAERDEDEYGKVDTGTQPAPKPASGEPVESDEFAHANDDD
jgi:hypothetical protein